MKSEEVQRLEDTIQQLQSAVEYYLEQGDLQTALLYSEIFKFNCEAYKALTTIGNSKEPMLPEFVQEKPQFRFGKQALSGGTNNRISRIAVPQPTIPQEQISAIANQRARQDYENRMVTQYLQQFPPTQLIGKANPYQEPQPSQPVVSQYSYGDGMENPKIRANDNYGNWVGNGEPNEIITPPQQLIGLAPYDNGDIWEEDPRRNFNQPNQ